MTNKELLKELKELRMLMKDLHGDARGNGRTCPCQSSGPVCATHAVVRGHILTADQAIREAIIVIQEFSMEHSR